MKKLKYNYFNNVKLSAVVAKRDAIINASGTKAQFRIAAGGHGNNDSVFFDCVMFPNRETGAPIPTDLLKAKSKVIITGYFHMNTIPGKDGQEPLSRMEIVVTDVEPNIPTEVEVPDAEAAAAPAPEAPAVPGAVSIDDLPGDDAGDPVDDDLPM